MKKIFAWIFVLWFSSPAWSATWYATSGSGNLSTRGYSATSTGSCTGSGATLTWASRGINDTLNLNGCTAVAIDVDPSPTPTTLTGTITLTNGSTALTGSGTNFTGQVSANDWIYIASQPPVQVSSVTDNTNIVLAKAYTGATTAGATGFDGIVSMTTDGTQGGAATYAIATGLTMHVILIATKTTVLTITGSTVGSTIIGAVVGASTNSINAVNDTHTAQTVAFIGNSTGGSGTSDVAYLLGASGTTTITGYCTSGTAGALASQSYGCQNSAGTMTIAGACVGSNTVNSAGCGATTASVSTTLTGNEINGLKGAAIAGWIYFTPGATNYILSPKDASYTLGTNDTHATIMVPNPGVAKVLSGTVYGPYSGTLVVPLSYGSVQ